MSRPIKDHKGKQYPSITALAKAYGLNDQTLGNRLRRNPGGDIEAILTAKYRPANNRIPIKDHLGVEYKSITAMAEAYHINPTTLRMRLRKHPFRHIRDILHPPCFRGNPTIVEYDGCTYESITELAQAYGVNCKTLAIEIRENNGVITERMLTPACDRSPIDHPFQWKFNPKPIERLAYYARWRSA